MPRQEVAFDHLVSSRLHEAEQITGHYFKKIRDLIAQKGSVEAVRFLLSPERPGGFTEGFEILARHKLLSHSIEQAAVDFAKSGLFSEEQLSKARAQLAIARMIWLPTRQSLGDVGAG
jgi:hypothetical protein